MGVSWRQLDVPGHTALIGRGVHYGASRSDAPAAQGLAVHLVGAGNSAGQAALFLANHAQSVTLVVRGGDIADNMSAYLVEQIRAKANITVLLRSEIRGMHGDASLTGLDIADRETGVVRRVASGGVFLFIGADAETGWLPAEIARDERGFILTGSDALRSRGWHLKRDPYLVETSSPGIFACGDVRLSPVKRVAAAAGEGSMAIAFAHQYLATEAADR
jgi:thioredoxin reductase (NADPH)